MWQQQKVRRWQQEGAGGSVSDNEWELQAAAYEQQEQQEEEEEEGERREQVVWVNPWVNPWEISEARKVQLLAARHV